MCVCVCTYQCIKRSYIFFVISCLLGCGSSRHWSMSYEERSRRKHDADFLVKISLFRLRVNPGTPCIADLSLLAVPLTHLFSDPSGLETNSSRIVYQISASNDCFSKITICVSIYIKVCVRVVTSLHPKCTDPLSSTQGHTLSMEVTEFDVSPAIP